MPFPALEPDPELTLDGVLRPGRNAGWREAFLPSCTVQCHAANLQQLANGDIACVWFGGTQEGMADISIWFSRLPAGGDRWTRAVQLSDDPERSEQNPILFETPERVLHLIWTAQRAGNQDTAVVRSRISADFGASWGPVFTLLDVPGTFVRQPPVINGDHWMLPVFLCRVERGQRWSGDNDISAVLHSNDAGRSWTRRDVPGSVGAVHMSIVSAGTGRMLAFYRSRWADFIYRSVSEDGGSSWSAPKPTALPNNNASIQALRLADGRLAVVYNHASAADATERRVSLYDEIQEDMAPDGESALPPVRTAFWGAPRAPVAVALSVDDGFSFAPQIEVETGSGYCMTNNSRERLNRELSYPSIRQAVDGSVHLAFTYFRRAIKHVVLPLENLR